MPILSFCGTYRKNISTESSYIVFLFQKCLRPKTCHAFLTIFVRKNDNIFALQSIVIVVFLVLSIRSDKKLLLKENIALISMQTLISNIINILQVGIPH